MSEVIKDHEHLFEFKPNGDVVCLVKGCGYKLPYKVYGNPWEGRLTIKFQDKKHKK